jgi:Tfp pilus assembly protein PilX
MIRPQSNERGAAMVLVLGVLAALAVLALVVMRLVMSEKRTQFTDYANNRSFYSADAAGEAGVAWIRQQPSPPSLVDSLNHVSVSNAYTTLSANHLYKYNVQFVRKKYRPGWSLEYKDFEYLVEASGASTQQAESAVELGAMKMFKEGY